MRSTALTLSSVFCVASFGLAGCTSSDSERPTFEVIDSLGVEIVLSHAEAGFGTPWVVSAEAVLRIGKGREEEPYLFGSIRGLTRLPDGSIVVLDGQSNELRRFDPQGNHLVSFGGEGGGPGEFRSVRGGIQRAADTLLVLDGDATLARFSPDGRLIAESPGRGLRAGEESTPGDWLGVLPDGVLWGLRNLPASAPALGVVDRNPMQVVISDPARTHVTVLGEYPGQASLETQWYGGYYPVFMTFPSPNRAPSGILVGDNQTFTIDLYDSTGALLRRMAYPEGIAPPEPWQMDALQAALQAQYEARPESRRIPEANFRQWLTAMPEPEGWPGFSHLLGDELGFVWALEYVPTDFTPAETFSARRALVFHPSGYLMGSLELPGNVTVVEIGSDYVLGVETDSLGVQEAVLYQLTRG